MIGGLATCGLHMNFPLPPKGGRGVKCVCSNDVEGLQLLFTVFTVQCCSLPSSFSVF